MSTVVRKKDFPKIMTRKIKRNMIRIALKRIGASRPNKSIRQYMKKESAFKDLMRRANMA